MSSKPLLRVLAPVIAAVTVAAIAAACGIPTEDQPQPINREQNNDNSRVEPVINSQDRDD